MPHIFNTIHIFGYGETQIISAETNGKVDSTGLSHLANLVNFIKGQRPVDIAASDFHVIHIFESGEVKYLGKVDPLAPKVKCSYSFKVSKLEASDLALYNDLFGKLHDELKAAVTP